MILTDHIIIEPEHPDDVQNISSLTTAAFALAPHSAGTEASIIAGLRAGGALTLSLVARGPGGLVGHAAFSPVEIGAAAGWYGLGPVSVAPAQQGQGIGAALIRDGLARLAAMGAAGCVVLGDPGYYRRFGFVPGTGPVYPGLPPEYFMALTFAGQTPTGPVTYHPAFGA